MADVRKELLNKFKQNIYRNFGPLIKRVQINGIRGLSNFNFEINFPVTAISGTNGSGKSTIGQVAICAYRSPSTDKKSKRKYIKDFFPQSENLDPNPFTDNANIIYTYATNVNQDQQLTVSRKNVEWSGYKRQPERHCFYIGFSAYLPKVEKKGMSIYNSKYLELAEPRNVDEDIKLQVASILSSDYDEIYFQGIRANEKSSEIGVVSRYGYTYSENNMGFGEGRLLYMVDLLENQPDNSLFILEEPETSLHGDAQYKFIKYLMKVASKKGHQIIFSTHSSIMLNALPPEGRKFLTRSREGVRIIDRVSAYTANSLLANGHEKALSICVEDDFAKKLLNEILRSLSQIDLKTIQIASVGDKDAVRTMVNQMKEMEFRVIGVRDADVGENLDEDLLSFPGNEAPEKEVFLNSKVQEKIEKNYSVDVNEIINTSQDINDHHDYSKALANEGVTSSEIIEIDSIRSYIDTKGTEYFRDLIDKIKNRL
jgi:predicted ATPase